MEQICIHVKQILQTTEINNLYIPNKVYELTQQIIEEEQIFTEGKNKYLKENNKYVKKIQS
jgi:hypothetical protein